jgi:hypothetical protein
MNDECTPEWPIEAKQAPDHAPDFWNRLNASIHAETASLPVVQQPPPGAASLDATRELPGLASVAGAAPPVPVLPLPKTRRSQPKWPLAAAAVAVVALGLGFVIARGVSDPATTTEIAVASTDDADVASADGTGESDGDIEGVASAPGLDDVSDATSPGNVGDVEDAEETDAAETPTDDEAASAAAANASSDEGDRTQPAVAPIPDFEAAGGATGEPEYLPLDRGIPADGTYLANWPQRALTWYAVTAPDTNCERPGHSEIRYVNGSGITQPVRNPQLRFSGEISHFVVRDEQNVAAWVVTCGEQLELYVGTLEPTGRIIEPTLAWLGQGSTSSALVLWESNEVSLNAIEPNGAAFSIDYNIETGLLSRNGGPSRIMLEAGAPTDRSLTPLAASPDGGLTYWQGGAQAGTVSDCAELYGSGRSDMVWLRQGEGQWQHAVTGGFPIGTVTAGALDSASLQFAFADLCPGQSGRVLVGRQLADGRIDDVITIDLTPFVPGYGAQLFWVDEFTLRIETDNTEFGFGTVRFDYRLDQGVMVQLD